MVNKAAIRTHKIIIIIRNVLPWEIVPHITCDDVIIYMCMLYLIAVPGNSKAICVFGALLSRVKLTQGKKKLS